ncbi:MAG TPA: MBOAT family O-acyltransferase [Chitinophagaceae bacterium]|nr:MBOAT family O-acyltransferase [Chitinophagaceae bacterium]
MLFTSIIFFLFLFSSLFIYYLLPVKYRNIFLIAVSAFFYMYAEVEYIFLIIFIILSNYIIGIKIGEIPDKVKKKRYLYLSLLINLGILIFFKYWNFLIENVLRFLGLFHAKSSLPLLEIALPLGLSYYIFQTIGYILDIYRGSQKAEKNIFRFTLFTLFFPKLLVGPIERAGRFLPQISRSIYFNKENIIEGGKRIAWGLFKKLVVADRISIYENFITGNSQYQDGLTMTFATIIYTFQVYADFSGYTDIAIGTARLFGFDLMENFKQPLLAKNLSDFWRRWHISLSSWVNDYIFNPIAFNQRRWGNWGVFYALFISFFIIGIWHGASWNYVLFGALQAIALCYEVVTRKIRKKIVKKVPSVIYNNLSIALTFLYVSFSLIIFRTDTFGKAEAMIAKIFSSPGKLFYDKPSTLIYMLLGCSIMLIYDLTKEYKLFRFSLFSNKNWIVQQLSYAILIIYILLAGVFDGGQFIYFAF